MNKDKHIDLEFDYPLTKFDSAAITLTYTTEQLTEPQNMEYHFVQDTLNRRKYQLRAKWEPKAKYQLMIPAGAFNNIAREQNDTLKYSYDGSDPEKYALLNVKIMGAKPGVSYIVQLTNAQGKTQKEIRNVKNGDYRFEFVTPGDVMIRVVEDKNNNGKWDTGDFGKGIQPEKVFYYNHSLELRAMFEYTQDDWDINSPLNRQKPLEITKQKPDKERKKMNRNATRKFKTKEKK